MVAFRVVAATLRRLTGHQFPNRGPEDPGQTGSRSRAANRQDLRPRIGGWQGGATRFYRHLDIVAMVERKFEVDTCFLRFLYISGMENKKIRARRFSRIPNTRLFPGTGSCCAFEIFLSIVIQPLQNYSVSASFYRSFNFLPTIDVRSYR